MGGDRNRVLVRAYLAQGLKGDGRQIAAVWVIADVPRPADLGGESSLADRLHLGLPVELATHPSRSMQTS